MAVITVEDIKQNEEVKAFIQMTEKQLNANGFTEHSYRHVGLVSKNAGNILKALGYSDHEVELARVAGFIHDIGNAINRVDHAHSGGILAYNLLTKMGMSPMDAGEVMLAISNHDENTGNAVSEISAALILADKSDVHRSRVNNHDFATFDIHDRVNYAVEMSKISVNKEEGLAVLELTIDTKICPVMDYFEIFLGRMSMNRKAAEFLGLKFQLVINDYRLL